MREGVFDEAAVPAKRQLRGRRGVTMSARTGVDAIGTSIPVDPYRAVIFPNRIREQRIRFGHVKLLAFAATLPEIPYIRLSKIERGEVFARADELVRIGAALGIAPADLLLDVAAPDFDIADWFLPFADGAAADSPEEARFAMLLAATLRARRDADARLTAATMDAEYGIPPVILSRIENAQKGLARWNDQTVANLCRLFGVADEAALRDHVAETYRTGALQRFLAAIAGAEQRIARTRQRVAALTAELGRATPSPAVPAAPAATAAGAPAAGATTAGATTAGATTGGASLLPVYGTPLADGLVAMTPTGTRIEAPAVAGARAFGLRVGRATLGGGLPGQATVIVDPDRYPQAGGLALIRDGDGHRIVAVAMDRDGRMIGYSTSPAHEVAIDMLAPREVAAVVAAQFV